MVSGPAGVGKGTLVSRVRDVRPSIGLPVSATTREPRAGEIDGVSYHFLSNEQFDECIARGEFLEWANVHDHRYGTLRSEVDACLSRGESVILEIDVQGGENVRKAYPETIRIFIEPPSWNVLVERLKKRGSETEESLRIRLNTAKHELELASTYDVRLVNDDLEEAVAELSSILERFETV